MKEMLSFGDILPFVKQTPEEMLTPRILNHIINQLKNRANYYVRDHTNSILKKKFMKFRL